MAEVILMPRLSDTMTEGVIAAWHKKMGDTVKKGDLLAEIETDKATMELESYQQGVLLHIGTPRGGKLQVNDLLAIIGTAGEDVSALVAQNTNTGSETKAATNYQYVIDQPRSEFTEQSLSRLAQIYLKAKDCDKSIPVLVRLENEADFPQNKSFAQANLMKCYYDKKDYNNSVVYADKVLQNAKTDANVKADAQIIVARAAMQTGDEEKAKTAYAKLSATSKGELAAEALYYDAYFKTKEGKFDASNVSVQKLAKNYSAYKYYGAKGLVLMAKNFYGLKDSYQATYILDNVINNFTDFPDVVEEAKKELSAIKMEESKTNSSINK